MFGAVSGTADAADEGCADEADCLYERVAVCSGSERVLIALEGRGTSGEDVGEGAQFGVWAVRRPRAAVLGGCVDGRLSCEPGGALYECLAAEEDGVGERGRRQELVRDGRKHDADRQERQRSTVGLPRNRHV